MTTFHAVVSKLPFGYRQLLESLFLVSGSAGFGTVGVGQLIRQDDYERR